MATVYIGIGSNLGDREENCGKAVALLIESGVKVIKRSSLYETEPWGFKEQPMFINMVLEIETQIEPEELLKVLKQIEIKLGRVEGKRWMPRIIDLDILVYNDLIIKTSNLEIPHPGMHERTFVLEPLSEIAPDKIHPVFKKTFNDLLRSCP